MRLLLDTHIALWAISDDNLIPKRAMDLMLDPENEVWASVVNIWETAIKHAARRKEAAAAVVPGETAWRLLEKSGFPILSVTPAHAAAVDELPPHHRDPFDRMLVAQARSEPMRLLTSDATLAAYGDHVMVV